MFLIDFIKPNMEKKFKPRFLRDCLWVESCGNKIKPVFVSFCVRFVKSNKNIIQKKREYLSKELIVDYYAN